VIESCFDDVPWPRKNKKGDYFQLAFFLIIEKIKGEKSFWKPYIDALPQVIETLLTIDLHQSVENLPSPFSDRNFNQELTF
jgi:hypothetical protein